MNSKLEKIQNDIDKVFGHKCIMTGDEIKEILKEIYSNNGLGTYIEIKNLEDFGYSLNRFLDEDKFKYNISKNSC